MGLTSGTRLGPYEIRSAIGSGGMGDVYRAHDTRLHRDVAIKVLPDVFASDPERLARFEREAQVLAALNHPHIAHVYGFEPGPREGGVNSRALVMELVEGDTLAEKLAASRSSAKSSSALPIDEVLEIARQIADALDAAHERGVIHRDLKPANVKVRPDGTVKVLDFGLANWADGASGAGRIGEEDLLNSPTITSPAMTVRGTILGTAAYMAPEQAKGKTADKRADIWAFGCVLFEMLTGGRPFTGDSINDTLAAVIKDPPDWNALPAATPAPIRRVLTRCLEKDVRRRLRDIADARLEIDEAIAPAGQGPPRDAPARTPIQRREIVAVDRRVGTGCDCGGVGSYVVDPVAVGRGASRTVGAGTSVANRACITRVADSSRHPHGRGTANLA